MLLQKITFSNQYGSQQKKQDAVFQITEAVKTLLFTESKTITHAPSGAEQQIRGKIALFEDKLKSAKEDKNGLLSRLKTAHDKTSECRKLAEEEKTRKFYETLFVLSLHGLSQALVAKYYETKNSSPDDVEAADEDDEESEWQALEISEADDSGLVQLALWTEERSAIYQISNHIHALLGNLQDDDQNFELISKFLLTCQLETFEEMFGKKAINGFDEKNSIKTPNIIYIKDEGIANRIAEMIQKNSFSWLPHPLKTPICYQTGSSSTGQDGDDTVLTIPLMRYRKLNSKLKEFKNSVFDDVSECGNSRFSEYLAAINQLQSVEWRLNQKMWFWINCLVACVQEDGDHWAIKKGHIKVVENAGLSGDEFDNLRQWVLEKLYAPGKNKKKRAADLPGSFIDHPETQSIFESIDIDEKNSLLPRFYHPWKADYRGRMYAYTEWLTPQGGDIQKALLEFYHGELLDDSGLQALCRHGGGLASRSKLLSYFKIDGRKVVTLEEREQWVKAHESQILDCAKNPLIHSFWRECSSDPFQFLAFCLAYNDYKQGKPVYLPVQIDGTCNGLQHIAALSGDLTLARSVNVAKGLDDNPGDIYTEIADAVMESLGQIKETPIEKAAIAWIYATNATMKWLTRDTAKKVIMTIPYGATQRSQINKVKESLQVGLDLNSKKNASFKFDDFLKSYSVEDLPETKALLETVQADRASKKEQHGHENLREIDFNADILPLLAKVIVKHLVNELNTRFPGIGRFTNWLNAVSDSIGSIPLAWTTPLDFTVCQDKFTAKETTISATLGGDKIQIHITRLTDEVNNKSQKTALLPNFIHSLDATHLAMTLQAAQQQKINNISAIHDCLLCRPNEAAQVAQIAREQFARLYQTGINNCPQILNDWADWMQWCAQLTSSLVQPVKHLAKGAIEYPEGDGARRLAADNSEEAKAVKNLVKSFGTFPETRQLLAKWLMEFPSGKKTTKTKKNQFPAELPTNESDSLIFTPSFEISEYFFS